jgi:hypothetical protein
MWHYVGLLLTQWENMCQFRFTAQKLLPDIHKVIIHKTSTAPRLQDKQFYVKLKIEPGCACGESGFAWGDIGLCRGVLGALGPRPMGLEIGGPAVCGC